MKAKRLVSVLLAVMLLIGMIPTGAFAALSGSNIPQQTKDDVRINFELLIGSSFGGSYTYNGNTYTVTEAEYRNGRKAGGSTSNFFDSFSEDATAEAYANNIAIGDNAFNWKDKDGNKLTTLELEKGDTFYLGVKCHVNDATDEFGLFNYVAAIEYDSSLFKPAVSGALSASAVSNTFIPNAATTGLYNYAVMDNVVTKAGAEYTEQEWQDASAYTKDTARKYYGEASIENDYGYIHGTTTDGYTPDYVVVSIKSNGASYIPSETAWDVVIPMTVIGNPTSESAAFKVVNKATDVNGSTGTQISIANGIYDGSTAVNSIDSNETVIRRGEGSNVYQMNFGTSDADAAKATFGDATADIVKYAAGPAEEADYSNSITNRKNMPFLSEDEASAEANENQGPNDMLQFPENEDQFAVGDQVYIYTDGANGEKKLLGKTTITKDKLFNYTTNAYLTDADTVDSVAGLGLALVPDGKAMGYGYIAGQTKLYVGRMDQASIDAGDVTVNPNKLKEVTVTAETPVYFTDNMQGVPGSTLGTITYVKDENGADTTEVDKDNTIKVKLGDELLSVSNSFDNTLKVNAPVEGGETVETTLDWSNMKATYDVGGKAVGSAFNAHGKATIVVPYKNVGGTHVQPGGYAAEDDHAKPPYGAVLHVEVEPDPADYYVENGTDGADTVTRLTIKGNAKTALSAYMQEQTGNKQITFRVDSESGAAAGSLMLTAGTAITDEPYAITAEAAFPAAGGKVYLTLPDGAGVIVPVNAVAAHTVVEDVIYVGNGPNGSTYVTPDATRKSVLLAADPTFKISGVETPIHIDPATLEPSEIDNHVKVTLNGTEVADAATTGFDTKTKSKDDGEYVITYTIPDHDVAAATEGVENADYAYTGGGHKIVVALSIVPKVRVGLNGVINVSNVVNRPNGQRQSEDTENTVNEGGTASEGLLKTDNWDTFDITNDTYGDVALGDYVKLYQSGNNTPVANGYVYAVGEMNEGKRTVSVKVTQLGRDPSGLKVEFTRRTVAEGEEILPSDRLTLTDGDLKKEQYSFKQIVVPNPNEVSVSNDNGSGGLTYSKLTDFYTAAQNGTIEGLPNTATVEYGYYAEGAEGTFAIEESTVKQATLNTVVYSGGNESTDGNHGLDYLNGENDTTITASGIDALESDVVDKDGVTKVAIVGKPATATFTMKITLTSTSYEEGNGPALADVASAITVNNNRYPEADTVVIDSTKVTVPDGKTLMVSVYKSAEDATAGTGALGVLKVGTADEADRTVTLGGTTEVLAKNGGSLYIRARLNDTLVTDTNAPVNYTYESFTYWDTTISDSEATIKLNRSQLDEKTTDEEKLTFIKEFLTDYYFITAVRFVPDPAGDPIVDTSAESTVNKIAVQISDKWTQADGTALSGGTDMLGSTAGKTVNLKTEIDETTFNDKSVKAVTTKPGTTDPLSATVEYTAPEGLNTRATDFNAVTSTLSISTTADQVMTLPFEKEQAGDYISAVSGKPEETAGDAITVSVPDTMTDLYGEGATMNIVVETESGATTTYTATLGTDTSTTGKQGIVVRVPDEEDGTTKLLYGTLKNAEGADVDFAGFPADATVVKVTFIKEKTNEGDTDPTTYKSAALTIPVEVSSGAETVKTAVPEIAEVSFATGSVRTDTDLAEKFLNGIEKVTVTTEQNTTIENMTLAKTSGKVNWTLMKKEGEGAWTAVTSDHKTALSSPTVVGTLEFKAVADIDLTSSADVELENPDGDNKVLAEVALKVYDKSAPEAYPMQLTEGNNDLYTDGDDESTRAGAYLTELNGGTFDANAYKAYKDYAVYYYMIDSYAAYEGIEARGGETIEAYTTMAGGIQGIPGVLDASTETKFADWIAADANKDAWSIQELKLNETTGAYEAINQAQYDASGNQLSGENATTTHIQPHFSESKDEYFTPSASYKKLDESYIIRYTVNYQGKRYVFDREVKLTYKPGDLNFDYEVSSNDSVIAVQIGGSGQTQKLFVPTDADKADEARMAKIDALEKSVGDINNDGEISSNDGVIMVQIGGSGGAAMPNIRW